MADNKGVKFVRIHGRVIPIKVKVDPKKQKRDLILGAGYVAAGVATEIAAGKIAAASIRSAAKFENSARGFVNAYKLKRTAAIGGEQLAFKFAQGAAKNASRSMLHSLRAIKSYRFLKTVGIGLGSTLTTLGLLKLYEGATKKEPDMKTTLAAGTTATFSGAAAKFVFNRSMFKSLGATSKVATSTAWTKAFR